MKTCKTRTSGCLRMLPLEAFVKDKRAKDGCSNLCKECHNVKTRKFTEDNLESERLRKKQWSKDNPETKASIQVIWRQNNPDKVRAMNSRQRAQRRNQVGYMPDGWFDAMIRVYGYSCESCGTEEEIQVDHVIALANGGLDEIRNLQFLCGTENRQKSNVHNTDYRSVRLLDTLTGRNNQ